MFFRGEAPRPEMTALSWKRTSLVPNLEAPPRESDGCDATDVDPTAAQVKRVHAMRAALLLLDFDDDSIVSLKRLLLR